jgi:NADH:ubiquinone oxidoreductase subunit E
MTMEDKYTLTEEIKNQVDELMKRFHQPTGVILPSLRLVQEKEGYVTPAVCHALSAHTGIPAVKWWETATFYTMYQKKAVGKYVIGVCMNVSCYILDSKNLLTHLKDTLGIDRGETTPCGLFTLETVECLCCCGKSPVISVNDEYYENMTIEKLDELLATWRREAS